MANSEELAVTKIERGACLAILLLSAGCGSNHHGGEASIAGEYVVLSHLAPHSLEHVNVVVVIDFYCPACRRFETDLLQIKRKYGQRITVKDVPITRMGGSKLPVQFYILAQQNGLGDAARQALYKAKFEDNKDIGNVAVLAGVARAIGLRPSALARIGSSDIIAEKDRLESRAQRYAHATPTILVEDELLVQPDIGALQTVIDGLLKTSKP